MTIKLIDNLKNACKFVLSKTSKGTETEYLTKLTIREFNLLVFTKLKIKLTMIHENNKSLEHVDFQPLFDWINTQLNTKVEFNIDLTGQRPVIVSPNLVGDSGIFSAVVREVQVGFFNFGHIGDGLWGTIYLHYESWNGGSNSMKIGDVWYSPEKGWRFETCKERTLKYEQSLV